MLYGRRYPKDHPDEVMRGRLKDIQHREPITYADGSVDVPVSKMPDFIGPAAWDERTHDPIPHVSAHEANIRADAEKAGHAAMIRTMARLTGKTVAEVEAVFAEEVKKP